METDIRKIFLRHPQYPGGFGEEDGLAIFVVGYIFFLAGDKGLQ